MKSVSEGISVSVLGKELTVACPPEEREALRSAAAFLDRKMREVQESGKVIGAERCALMAGLNISNELLHAQAESADSDPQWPLELERRLKFLYTKIDDALRQETSGEKSSSARGL